MSADEIRLRSTYLLMVCARVVESSAQTLAVAISNAPLSTQPALQRTLRRELGILYRYWATRLIWNRLEGREQDAKQLNLAVLRVFTVEFKLPKDGSGLRYAGLSVPSEEARELQNRLSHALGQQQGGLQSALQQEFVHWREEVTQCTEEMLALPVARLEQAIRSWMDARRTPEDPIAGSGESGV